MNKLGIVGIGLSTALTARALSYDLSHNNAIVINGAEISADGFQPSGTGYFKPIVRGQENGIEQAYNTDVSNPQWSTKSGPWTHSVLMADLLQMDDNYVFKLDANEVQSQGSSRLNLTGVRLYTRNGQPSINNISSLSELGTLRWSLGDNNVWIDTMYDTGSGTSDLTLRVPKMFFQEASMNDQFTLYFRAESSDDGFEEWAALTVPEPSSLALTGLGIGAALYSFRRKK